MAQEKEKEGGEEEEHYNTRGALEIGARFRNAFNQVINASEPIREYNVHIKCK
jgi:hypothetical protein